MSSTLFYAVSIEGAVPEPAPARIFTVDDQEIGGTVLELGLGGADLSNAFDPGTGDHWWIAADEVHAQRSGVHSGLSVPTGKRGLAFRRDGHGFFFSAEHPGKVFRFVATNPAIAEPVELSNGHRFVDLAFDAAGRALLLTADGVVAEVADTSGPKWMVGRSWLLKSDGWRFSGLALTDEYVVVSGQDPGGSFITEVVFGDDGTASLEPPFDLGSIGKVTDLASAHFPESIGP